MFWESQVVHIGANVASQSGALSTHNQTRKAVEQAIAKLERGKAGFAFASGLEAITTILMLLRSGDHVVISEDCFGRSYCMIDKVLKEFGLTATFIDPFRENIAAAIRPKTRAIFVETPTDPMMKIVDLRRLVGLARMNRLISIVDNTILGPYFQRPLEFGIDLILHNGAKNLSGYNDFTGGLIVAREHEIAEKIGLLQNTTGSLLSQQDSEILLCGMKTLALRMDKQGKNAQKVAEWLSEHPKVKEVYYPGLQEHPGYDVQESQTSGHGGMVSFVVKEPAIVHQVLNRLEMFRLAESFGGVESLIAFPSSDRKSVV